MTDDWTQVAYVIDGEEFRTRLPEAALGEAMYGGCSFGPPGFTTTGAVTSDLRLDPNDARDVPLVLKRYQDLKSVAETPGALPDLTPIITDLIRSHDEKAVAKLDELDAIAADMPGWRYRLEEVEPRHVEPADLRGDGDTGDVRFVASYRVVWTSPT